MDVSLIVATVGRRTELQRLLESLMTQARVDFEIIVVDQSGSDEIEDLALHYGRHLVIRHHRSDFGLSRGRNVGIALSVGAIIGFPDDDCWYPENLLGKVLREFDRRPEAGLLLGRTVDENGVASVTPENLSPSEVNLRNVWICGNSNTLFVRRAALEHITFDEDLGVGSSTIFQSGEETDFILRAIQVGVRADFDSKVIVCHSQVETGIGRVDARRALAYSRGFGQVLRRHYDPKYMIYRTMRSLGPRLITSS